MVIGRDVDITYHRFQDEIIQGFFPVARQILAFRVGGKPVLEGRYLFPERNATRTSCACEYEVCLFPDLRQHCGDTQAKSRLLAMESYPCTVTLCLDKA